MLGAADEAWLNFLEHYHDDEIQEQGFRATADQLMNWIEQLKDIVKGETWEVHIVQCALGDIKNRLQSLNQSE
jgi:hypothetical protein